MLVRFVCCVFIENCATPLILLNYFARAYFALSLNYLDDDGDNNFIQSNFLYGEFGSLDLFSYYFFYNDAALNCLTIHSVCNDLTAG